MRGAGGLSPHRHMGIPSNSLEMFLLIRKGRVLATRFKGNVFIWKTYIEHQILHPGGAWLGMGVPPGTCVL